MLKSIWSVVGQVYTTIAFVVRLALILGILSRIFVYAFTSAYNLFGFIPS